MEFGAATDEDSASDSDDQQTPPSEMAKGQALAIPKLPRSIIGNNGPIITYYRPSNDG